MIIAFGGQKQSGKSTASKLLLDKGYRELKMADPLKDMLRELYSYSDYTKDEIEERIEGSLKEVPDAFLGTTPRYAMQTLGTEWRNLFNTNLWSYIWYKRAKKLQEHKIDVVCSDLRFPHELDMLKQLGGTYIWISRGELIQPEHESEQDMSSYADYIIQNDFDINFLRSEVLRILGEIRGRQQ